MIEKLKEITLEAGEVIRSGFESNFEIEFKTNESNLVTEIDKKSEALISDFIKKEFPGHGILAEESGKIKDGEEFIWVIDPLDGTTNFAHGFPVFSVSIGIQKNEKTIAGAVYDVMRNELYLAEAGSGASLNGKRLAVSKNSNLAHSLLVTGFPYNIKENPNNAIEKFALFLKNARAIRRLGSAAIDFCYVARGVFDGFWEVYLNPWDICAGKLIVEEAGGFVSDFNGNAISIYSSQILATNQEIHSQMIELLNSA